MFNRTSVALALVAFGAAIFTVDAMAETPWQQAHPRRTKVNARLDQQNQQNQRTHNEVRSGELSKGQAVTLHKEDQPIHERRQRPDRQVS